MQKDLLQIFKEEISEQARDEGRQYIDSREYRDSTLGGCLTSSYHFSISTNN